MNTDRDTELLKIAEKVSDAEPVDWADASGAHPALESSLSGLQRIEAVADAFRSVSRDTTETHPIGLRVWGRLDVLELIGAGSFGEVYRARDPLLDREVALKLRKETPGNEEAGSRRALDEGKRLARVRHPNVLTVHGADIDHGRVGLWTELVDGPDLRQLIAEHGPFHPNDAVTAAIAICRALNAVHEADLVHGDVKASNVFKDADGRIVLGDFGSASELDSSGVVSGSPVSLAPERLRGGPAEPSSDLYSLGVLLYFMLSGRYPVEGTTVEELLEQHDETGPISLSVFLPELPSGLVDLVDRAVDADPARRFTTAAELQRALEKTRETSDKPANTTTKPSPRPSSRHGRRWTVVLAAAAVAVIVFVGAAVLSPHHDHPLVADARLMLDTAEGPVALTNGAAIAPGDHLYLEIEAEAPVHVYVANEDETGAVYTLFPIPGLDLANPLPPGRHRLPGPVGGAVNDWLVTSSGGAETFLLVAASRSVPEIEERIAAWVAASASHAVSTVASEAPTLRGVGGLAQPPGSPGDGARLEELESHLAAMEPDGTALWTHTIVLNSSIEE
ncbi:MAG: serine/threonine-protein kinase [Thermoanaerobaculales bacterium]|jgi:hypothetical protein|nr:serine/threonine-protein kinase [Thermoanaerobaculales bacterium]